MVKKCFLGKIFQGGRGSFSITLSGSVFTASITGLGASDINPAGLEIPSAEGVLQSSFGPKYIYLESTSAISSNVDSAVENYFGGREGKTDPPSSEFVVVSIDGIFNDAAQTENTEIIQTNQALYFFKNTSYATNSPITSARTEKPSIYLADGKGLAYRWWEYTGGTGNESHLEFLIWKEADNKTVHLDIRPEGEPAYVVVIDYSGVEFN
jgi:hypothetical protein